jgi:hypothetical protein
MCTKFLAGVLTALCLMLPPAAQAQDQVPSYASPQYSADQNIHGRVTAFDGGYNLQVRDERGYVDNVHLHPGTIINPTGLTLAPGMVVSVLGYNAGSYFSANEIDTPYQFDGGFPYYAGHPWNYWGPSVSLGFFFGNGGWWHARYFGGGYHWAGGVRVYASVHVNDVYRSAGGTFHGRDVVAPSAHGGYYGHSVHAQGHAVHGGGGHAGHPGGHDHR